MKSIFDLIILAGGASQRMGRPKGLLPWNDK
ncbi:MAG: NTP transferase domain-containing protein, partial [Bacteriovoracia bacterium]